MTRAYAILFVFCGAAACAMSAGGSGDAGGPAADAGPLDAGSDGGTTDAGMPGPDAGGRADASVPEGDGGIPDSDSFVDSVGADSHFNYRTSTYDSSRDQIAAWLEDAGFRHLRDALVNATFADGGAVHPYELGLCQSGVHFSLGFDLLQTQAQVTAIMMAQTDQDLACIDFVEPANEADGAGGDWATGVVAQTKMIHDIFQSNPKWARIPVLGPSLISASAAHVNLLIAAAAALGTTLEAISAAGNIHTGNCWYMPEDSHAGYASAVAAYRLGWPHEPLWVTEFDGNDAPSGDGCYTPDVVEATYEPRVWAHDLELGIARTYHYQLVDMTSDAIFGPEGLLDQHGAPKPTAFALAHLMALLADPGPAFAAVPADLTFGGDTTALHHLLFQRRDGTYQLLLWRAEPVWNYSAFASGGQFHPDAGLSFPAPTEVTVTTPWTLASASLYATTHACNVSFTRLDFPSRTNGVPTPYAQDPTPVPTGGPQCWDYPVSSVTPSGNTVTVPVDATIAVLALTPG